MAKYQHIFQPVKIGSLTLKNRIEMAPIGPLFGSNLPVTREHYEWARQFARGGVAVVTIGDTDVSAPYSMPGHNAISLASDRVVNPLSIYAETVHRYGAKASIELNYHSAIGPSTMTNQDIKQIIESFASAAYRCLCAGLDIIMIHGAHGQLISRFTSGFLNKRIDDYGGTFEKRARLAFEILDAIRQKVGDRLMIEYRISAREFIENGIDIEDQIKFASLIQDKIDLLHVSAGNLFVEETLSKMIQPIYLPRGMNVEYASMFRRELKIPVVAVGSLDLDLAEKLLAENKADVIAIGRGLLADPDCLNKARAGKENEIRPCIRCNNCINRTHKLRLPARCTVNPYLGREAEFVNFMTSGKKKKVIVIGGGPAGMEAARISAGRGNNVLLFEKKPLLGGILHNAVFAPFKADLKKYLEWAIRTSLNTPNIELRLSTEATPEIVKNEHPEVLIIAIGAEPLVPSIPGMRRNNVYWAGDIGNNLNQIGKIVVVTGAGMTGSETALFLAQQGREVTLIDMRKLVEIDAEYPQINIMTIRSLLREWKVNIKEQMKLVEITDSGVVVIDCNQQSILLPCDSVVFALGMKQDPAKLAGYSELAPRVIAIGDCINGRGNLSKAISEGFFAGLET